MSAKRRRSDIDRAAVFEAILGDLGPRERRSPGRRRRPQQMCRSAQIRYNDQQPRHHIDPVALAQLTASVRQRGVLEPVLVRRVD
jgi:ParB family transcriptional regulator, chromosome partitioning protein